jgi:hypothetical protein
LVSPRKYLDIGIPSLKNLNGWKRKVLFTCLVLSTVPLHFLWNSVVFTTTQNVDCNVFVVTPSFFNDSTVDCIQKVSMYNQGSVSAYNEGGYATDYTQTPFQYGMGVNDSFLPSSGDYWQADICNISQPLLANAISGDLSRPSNEECILAYGPGNGNMRGGAGPIYSLSQNLQRPSPSQTAQFSFSFVTRNICPTTRATSGSVTPAS